MNTTYEKTIVLIENIVYTLQDMFLWIGNMWYLIFVLYVGYISILVWRLHYAHNTFNKINTLFKVSIDNLYYSTSLLLYNNQSNIHDFDTNIALLLEYKTKFIAKKEKAIYHNDFTVLLNEIEYIYKLIDPNKTIENKTTIVSNHELLIKLSHTIDTINNILSISTLHLYKLFK